MLIEFKNNLLNKDVIQSVSYLKDSGGAEYVKISFVKSDFQLKVDASKRDYNKLVELLKGREV